MSKLPTTTLTNKKYEDFPRKNLQNDFSSTPIYFPNEIDFTKFTILEKVVREPKLGSWSARILYDKDYLKIQTPVVITAFDLSSHIYKNAKRAKYSLCLSLDPTINGVKELIGLINEIDATTLRTFQAKDSDQYDPNLSKSKFIKIVKYSENNQYPPTIRCNLVSNMKQFKCRITKNGENIKDSSIMNVTNLLKKGTKVRCILELNPVWFNPTLYLDKKTNKKSTSWGVSWRIVAIDIVKPNISFRD